MFPETPFGGISQGMAGARENLSGQKIIFFFLPGHPGENFFLTFFLSTTPSEELY